jgi:Tfp pilus assembly protein PilZ
MNDKEDQTSREKTEPKDKADEKKSPCQVTFLIEGRSYSGTSTHFHEKGMLVLCDKPAALNTRLTLVLRFPGIKSAIELQGEVVWTNMYGPNDTFSPRGMGVKYLNADRDMERLLGELSAQYQESGFSYSCYYT